MYTYIAVLVDLVTYVVEGLHTLSLVLLVLISSILVLFICTLLLLDFLFQSSNLISCLSVENRTVRTLFVPLWYNKLISCQSYFCPRCQGNLRSQYRKNPIRWKQSSKLGIMYDLLYIFFQVSSQYVCFGILVGIVSEVWCCIQLVSGNSESLKHTGQ